MAERTNENIRLKFHDEHFRQTSKSHQNKFQSDARGLNKINARKIQKLHYICIKLIIRISRLNDHVCSSTTNIPVQTFLGKHGEILGVSLIKFASLLETDRGAGKTGYSGR